jgi:protoporphyrinogen/coproporphyrinogen III oxidase
MSRRAVVIGGGITGLSAAWSLARRAGAELEVTLIESRQRLGGNIVTERRDGFLLDGGPDSFLRTKRDAADLCRELGIDQDLIRPRPQSSKLYMVHEGALEPMPAGMALAVPTRLGPMLKTPLVSFPAKLRMLGDLVLPRGGPSDGADESIEAFLARRFGRQAARRLAAPLLGGIYAGNIGELSVRATFPQLVELEQKHGSLVRGLLGMRKRAGGGAPESPFLSLAGGMGELVEKLAAELPPGCAKTGVSAERVTPASDGRWRIELAGAEPLEADAVLLATPAHVAGRLVPDAELARELEAIPYASTATVFFGWPRAAVSHPLDGVGFVAPKGETALIAATWVTSKWDGRAPDDHVLVRAFLGGAHSPLDIARASDDELFAVARTELERLMGKLGEPLLTRVFRYVDSNPQPLVGHVARLERIRVRLERLPGLELAGAAYDGVGIPDCIRQGRQAADRMLGSPSLFSGVV